MGMLFSMGTSSQSMVLHKRQLNNSRHSGKGLFHAAMLADLGIGLLAGSFLLRYSAANGQDTSGTSSKGLASLTPWILL
jgi:hypothetical protein